MRFTERPISTYPGLPTAPAERVRSKFEAAFSTTQNELERELRHLRADEVVVEIDVDESAFRIDGKLRAGAKRKSPAIVLSFDSKHGPLRYACDRFTKWEDNLRAIAKGLEALRLVDRYGIAQKGEQYRGYQALGSGIPMGPTVMSPEQAAHILLTQADVVFDDSDIRTMIYNPDQRKRRYRDAVAKSHPDSGGSKEAFQELQDAMTVLNG